MKLIIEGTPKETADFIYELQNQLKLVDIQNQKLEQLKSSAKKLQQDMIKATNQTAEQFMSE